MRSIDDVYFDLISRFDNICRENGLKYYIATKNAMSIYRYNVANDGVNNFTVYMHVNDFKKLVDLINLYDDKDTYFDYISNNYEYFNTYATFGDKNSLDIEVNRIGSFCHKGICISIKPLIKSYAFKKQLKKITQFEEAWKNGLKSEYYPNISIIGDENYRKVKKYRENNNYEELQKWYLHNLFKLYSQFGIYKRYYGEPRLRKEYFKKPDEIKYRDKKFMTMTHLEDFFFEKYGKNWKNYVYQTPPNQFEIIHPDMSYETFFAAHSDMFDEIRVMNEKKINAVKRNEKNKNVFNKLFMIFKRSYYRIQFRDEFESQKDKICAAIENRNYKALKEFFYEYHKFTINCANYKLSTYINDDIKELYFLYLRKNKLGYLIKRIQKTWENDPIKEL